MIKLTAQISQFVLAASQLRAYTHVKIALGKLLYNRFQFLHRRGQIKRQQITHHAGNQNAHSNARSSKERRRAAGLAKAGNEYVWLPSGGDNKSAPCRPGGSCKQGKET